MADRTASFRTDSDKLARVDRLAEAMDRSRSWLINDALERYLDYEEWFRNAVADGIADFDDGLAVAHEDVMADARNLVSNANPKMPRR